MRVQKRNPWLYSLGVVLAAMVLSGSRAGADVTSDRPGSVTIWPKVIADGTRDTLITLTNTRNEEAYAHCEYVNAIGFCTISGAFCTLPSTAAVASAPACPGGTGDVCELQWQSLDFDVILTKQQPTIWRVSTGRRDDPLQDADAECRAERAVAELSRPLPRRSGPGAGAAVRWRAALHPGGAGRQRPQRERIQGRSDARDDRRARHHASASRRYPCAVDADQQVQLDQHPRHPAAERRSGDPAAQRRGSRERPLQRLQRLSGGGGVHQLLARSGGPGRRGD